MPEQITELSVRDAVIAQSLVEVVSASNRLTRYAARATGETESPAVWRTLAVLRTSGPLRIGELAAESRVAQPTMTKIVRGLAESEWVLRIADQEDARAWQIAITAKGERAFQTWRARLGEAMLPLFSDLTDEEIEVLASASALVHARIAGQLLTAGD